MESSAQGFAAEQSPSTIKKIEHPGPEAVMGNHVCCAEELLERRAQPQQKDVPWFV